MLAGDARTGIVRARTPVLRNRLLNAVSIGIPLAGTAIGVVTWPENAPSTATLVITILLFVINAMAVGIGMHRYFTHSAFETFPALRAGLAVLGSWAMQGPIDRWVADHRRHHRFTDKPFDPHSPYWIDDKPIRSRIRGLLHAHIGWMLTGDVSDPNRYARDIRDDRITRWASDHYWALCATSLLVPGGLGYAFGGTAQVVPAVLWAGCFRVALLHQLTWSVNSFGHVFGRKQPGAKDQSRDNPFLAFMLMGEGLHSYHHRFPAAGVNEPLLLDQNGWLLLGLERIGLVWNLKHYPEEKPTTDQNAGDKLVQGKGAA
jgi:stearoyl-CoA desaturase (delta-9 desaturase)